MVQIFSFLVSVDFLDGFVNVLGVLVDFLGFLEDFLVCYLWKFEFLLALLLAWRASGFGLSFEPGLWILGWN